MGKTVQDIKIKISNDTLKLLLDKISELENRITELEQREPVVNNTLVIQ